MSATTKVAPQPEVEGTVDQRRLVERARQGDHDAFAELARAAVVRLDRAARLILRDPELARDAVQEGLIRAWRDLPKLRELDRFDAWLHRLTVNSCIDQTRRRRRRPVEVELTPIHAPAMADMSGALADRDLVDGVLRRLDERGRAIVVLHYYLGMPLTEVATTLGIPVGTVKSRLHRALVEMRVAIGAEPTADTTPVARGQLA
ncbi:MAG: sigma-70 family RNA polymerase sigma factor [Chloroflexota bacterium]